MVQAYAHTFLDIELFFLKLSLTNSLEMNINQSEVRILTDKSPVPLWPPYWIFEARKGFLEREIYTKWIVYGESDEEIWGPAYPKSKHGGSVNYRELKTVTHAL